jgi:hypothetical protein
MHILLTQHTLLAADSIHATGLVGAGLILLPALLYAVLFVRALISITSSRLGGGMKLAWIVFAFIAPFLGIVLWFVFGRCAASRRRRFA